MLKAEVVDEMRVEPADRAADFLESTPKSGGPFRDLFVNRILPDARRRWIWWCVGLPLLRSAWPAMRTTAEDLPAGPAAGLEAELQWAEATRLVDEALTEWVEHHERGLCGLHSAAGLRALALRMHTWVIGRILREVEQKE